MRFEGIAKTDTTHTERKIVIVDSLFEGIAKTDTTHTRTTAERSIETFEGIAKTDTTHTMYLVELVWVGLRVLLKQTQLTRFCFLSHQLEV